MRIKNRVLIILCCFATLIFQGQPLTHFSTIVFAQEEGSSESAPPVEVAPDPVNIEIPQVEPTPSIIEETVISEAVIDEQPVAVENSQNVESINTEPVADSSINSQPGINQPTDSIVWETIYEDTGTSTNPKNDLLQNTWTNTEQPVWWVQYIAIETIYETDSSLWTGIEALTWSVFWTWEQTNSWDLLLEDTITTQTIMQLDTTTVIFPTDIVITNTLWTEKQIAELTIVPEEAVTQLPNLTIKEVPVEQWMRLHNTENTELVVLSWDNTTIISWVDSISNVNLDQIIETSTVVDATTPTKEPLQEIFEFGIAGEHLLFSEPVLIQQAVPYPDGSLVEINVFHAWQADWWVQWIATEPWVSCTPNWDTTIPSTVTKVNQWKIQFTTCGASTFSVVYTWWASAPNFVDNGTKDYTGMVLTGVNFPTGSVIQDVNIRIDFRPINNESPTWPWWVSNCYPNEKSFLLIHPDWTTVALANAWTYTAPNTTCPQAQITYDQSAASGIVWWAWNLTWQSRQPVWNLSTLNGKSPFGMRTLRMGDNAWQDWVILFWYSIDIQNVDCGDGIITSPEVCDDGNIDNDDWCSALCSIEAWWECTWAPSVCTEIPAPTGLRLHYDGSFAGWLYTDISGNWFDGTQFNGVTTGNQNGETVMCFNGTNQYIQRATNLVTAYPFTMSTWMKSDTTAWLHGVVSFARSTATNRMRNIEHNGTTIRQNAQNTTATYTNAATALNTTEWFLVTAVFNSATDRDIYINGIYDWTNTTNETYSSNAANRLNIWRLADSSPTNYYDGCVDDIRFYSTALTSGQVYTLYAKPASLTTSAVTVWSPQLTGTIDWPLDTITLLISWTTYTGTNLWNGTWNLSGWIIAPALPNGTYPVTLTVTNPYWRSVQYTSAFTVTIPPSSGDFCIAWPSTIAFPQITTQGYAQTWFTSTSGYFQVIDSNWADSGYYTTLQITNLSWSTTSLSNTWIARQSTGIVLLSGTANTGVTLWSAFASYSPATWTVTFIKRDPAANSWKTGTYWAPLQLRISLPAYIKPDTYAWTITYTLYEN
jgi:cysteine-rich repeat protein